MQKHSNTVPHDPPNTFGDCHRACFATILGLQPHEVPHFYEHPETDSTALIMEFLSRFGLMQAHVLFPGETNLREILTTLGHTMPGVPAILGGTSSRGCGHSVVILDGEIYNDPTGSGIIGPMGDYYWITLFVAQPNFALGRFK